MENNLKFTAASEEELNELFIGHKSQGFSYSWPSPTAPKQLMGGTIGVLYREEGLHGQSVQPLAVVVRGQELKRLFGRFAQVRSDFAPLTAWCHVIPTERFDSMDSVTRTASLDGTEAAWAGLVIAEAMLLAERPVATLRISACLATPSFALARAQALWGNRVEEVVSRFDTMSRLLKGDGGLGRAGSRVGKLRVAMSPIWTCLSSLSNGQRTTLTAGHVSAFTVAIRALQRCREVRDPNEAGAFSECLSQEVPESEELRNLEGLTPELRLRVFDRLIAKLAESDSERPTARRTGLAMLAGYLATVAAGGAPSLSLADNLVNKMPEVSAWAYLLGGIGERIVWTSSFDGLGRLVARELTRPFRLDELPTSDFSFEEADAVVDPQLRDPLVHLRIKQARLLTVALFPGVNVLFAINEAAHESVKEPPQLKGRNPEPPPNLYNREMMRVLADSLWPLLEDRLDEFMRFRQSGAPPSDWENRSGRGKKRTETQSKLPLSEQKKKDRP